MKTMNLDRPLKLLTLSLICNFAIGQPQIQIDSVIGVGRDAIGIGFAQRNGVLISTAGNNGVFVQNAGANGVSVVNSWSDGFLVIDAGGHGIRINSAGADGVRVNHAGNDGVYVQGAGGFSMNIQGSRDMAATPAGHIAQIYNKNTGSGPDVLALKVGTTSNPGVTSNFITFFRGDARIEGNGSGVLCSAHPAPITPSACPG